MKLSPKLFSQLPGCVTGSECRGCLCYYKMRGRRGARPPTGPLTFRNERDRKTQGAAQQQRDALRLPPAVVVQDVDDQDQRGDFDQTAQDEVAVPVTHYGTGAHRQAVVHERVDHPAGTHKYTDVKTSGKTDQKSFKDRGLSPKNSLYTRSPCPTDSDVLTG